MSTMMMLGTEGGEGAYGAALVSKRMFLFFRSCGSGRCCRCFSSESRRPRGEMGVESTLGAWDWSAMGVCVICGFDCGL